MQSAPKLPRIYSSISPENENSDHSNKDGEIDSNDESDDVSSISSMPLEDKLEEIQYLQDHEFSLRRASNIVQAKSKAVGKYAIQAGNRAATLYLQPKVYENHIRAKRNTSIVKNVIREEKEILAGRNRQRESFTANAKKLKDIQIENKREKRRISQHITDQNRKLTNKQHEDNERKKRIREFLDRREKEKKELHRVKLEEEERLRKEKEKQEKEKREQNLKHWTEKAKEYKEDAKGLLKKKEERGKKKDINDAVLPIDPLGIEEEDELANDLTSFNINTPAAEANSAQNEISGKKQLLTGIYRSSKHQRRSIDNDTLPEVDLFSKAFSTEREEKRVMQMELETRQARSKLTLDNIKKDVKKLEEEIEVNRSVRSRLLLEKAQNNADAQVIKMRQNYPIQRDPSPDERKSMHMIKQRASQIDADLARSSEVEQSLIDKKEDMEKRIETHSKSSEIEELKQQIDTLKDNLATYDNDLSDLPIVVGRNLGKVSDPLLLEPSKTYDAIMHKSKTAIIHHETDEAVKMHKSNARVYDALWSESNRRRNEESELEHLRNRLARAERRLKEEEEENQRADVNFAIKKFWEAGCPLHKTGVSAGKSGHDEGDCGSIAGLDVVNESTNRVLSDFVKQIRLDEKVGNRRITNLLSELIEASTSNEEYWDSGALFGVQHRPSVAPNIEKKSGGGRPVFGSRISMQNRRNGSSVGGAKCFQRYQRDVFIDKMKKEVMRLNKSLISQQDGLAESNKLNRHIHENEHFKKSECAYLERKRHTYHQRIQVAKDLQGCFVELLDEPYQGRLIVKDCVVRWKENGIVPIILHRICRGDDDWNTSGDDMMIELEGRNFFVIRRPTENRISPVEKIGMKDRKLRLRLPGLHNLAKNNRSICIEKERWEMNETQALFYDFEVTKGVYKLGRIHKTLPEEESTFGDAFVESDSILQPEEIQSYFLDFRLEDIKRRAAFHDVLDFVGRIKCFQARINELQDKQQTLLDQKVLVTKKVATLRQDFQLAKIDLQQIEDDFFEAGRRIDTAAKAREDYKRSKIELDESIQNKNKARIALCKAQYAASDSRTIAQKLTKDLKSLLRARLDEEEVLPGLRGRARFFRERADACKRELAGARQRLRLEQIRSREQYILTRFGILHILYVRSRDMVVCGSLLPLKKTKALYPRMEKYVPMKECLDYEMKHVMAELRAMGKEDDQMRKYMLIEAKLVDKELDDLAGEERRLRETIKCSKIEALEGKMMVDHQTTSSGNAGAFLKTRAGRLELKRRAKTTFQREEQKRKEVLDQSTKFDSRSSIQRGWDRLMLKRKTYKEQKISLLAELAKKDEPILLYAQASESAKRVAKHCQKDVLNNFMLEFVKEICSDVLIKDTERKEEAIKSNNVVFTDHPFISLESYNNLTRLWMARKAELKKSIIGTNFERKHYTAGNTIKMTNDFNRCKSEQDLMEIEDSAHREYHIFESEKASLEKDFMMKEECEMMYFLLNEKIECENMRRKKAKNKAACKFVNEVVHKSAQCVNIVEQRHEVHCKTTAHLFVENLFFSAGMADSKEQFEKVCCRANAQVFVERALSLAVFSILSKAKRRPLHIGQSQIKLISKDYVFDLFHRELWYISRKVAHCIFHQKNIETKMAEQNFEISQYKSIEHNVQNELARKFVANFLSDAICVVEKEDTRVRWYGSNDSRTEIDFKKKLEAHCHANLVCVWRELDWMEREQEARMCEWELGRHENTMKSILLKTRVLGTEELKALMLHRRNERSLRFCQKSDIDASKMENVCRQNKFQRHEELRDAELKLQWMDTSALTKFSQRWATPKLHERLYDVYFRKLASTIAFHAEVVAVQKCLNQLGQTLTSNRSGIEKKTAQKKGLERKLRRQGLLRLRRSHLGRKMFTKERHRTLTCAMKAWIYFTQWHQGHRRSYELKFASFHYNELLKPAHLYEVKENLIQNSIAPVDITILEEYMARPIKCRMCGKQYTQRHNHERACQYHPAGKQSCCSRTGSLQKGCKYSFHAPPLEGHAEYSRQLDFVVKKDEKKIRELDGELEGIEASISKGVDADRTYLAEVANNLRMERNVSKRFQSIKFV